MAIPTIITNTNTAAPVRIFISCISLWDMPSNDTSIERCKERTEAAAVSTADIPQRGEKI